VADRALEVLDRPEDFRALGEAARATALERDSMSGMLPRIVPFYEEVAARPRVGGPV
jgi:hypothetical protein